MFYFFITIYFDWLLITLIYFLWFTLRISFSPFYFSFLHFHFLAVIDYSFWLRFSFDRDALYYYIFHFHWLLYYLMIACCFQLSCCFSLSPYYWFHFWLSLCAAFLLILFIAYAMMMIFSLFFLITSSFFIAATLISLHMFRLHAAILIFSLIIAIIAIDYHYTTLMILFRHWLRVFTPLSFLSFDILWSITFIISIFLTAMLSFSFHYHIIFALISCCHYFEMSLLYFYYAIDIATPPPCLRHFSFAFIAANIFSPGFSAYVCRLLITIAIVTSCHSSFFFCQNWLRLLHISSFSSYFISFFSSFYHIIFHWWFVHYCWPFSPYFTLSLFILLFIFIDISFSFLIFHFYFDYFFHYYFISPSLASSF